MPDRSRAIATWSAAVFACVATMAGFAQHIRWLFIPAIIVAAAALLILVSAGIPDLLSWSRDRTSRQETSALEITVKRRFDVDWENSRSSLAEAELIVQNNSASDVTVTKIALKPVGFSGPTKLVGGLLPAEIGSQKALCRMIHAIDFIDILNLTSPSGTPDEPMFSIDVVRGYGSTARTYSSDAFSLTPRSTQAMSEGFSGWTELQRPFTDSLVSHS